MLHAARYCRCVKFLTIAYSSELVQRNNSGLEAAISIGASRKVPTLCKHRFRILHHTHYHETLSLETVTLRPPVSHRVEFGGKQYHTRDSTHVNARIHYVGLQASTTSDTHPLSHSVPQNASERHLPSASSALHTFCFKNPYSQVERHVAGNVTPRAPLPRPPPRPTCST